MLDTLRHVVTHFAPVDDLLTINEVANRLRCSRETVYRIIRSGELTTVKVGQRQRVRVAALAAYVKSTPEEETL